MFDSDKSPKQGVPQGFTDDIPQSPLPDFGSEKSPLNTKVYIFAGIAIAFLMISITVFAIILGKSDGKSKNEKYSEKDMVDAYVSVIEKDSINTFDSFIYPKAKNKCDIKNFLKSSQSAFAEKHVYGDMTEIRTEDVTEEEADQILAALGKKAENLQRVSFDIYYSPDTASEPECYTTFLFYTGEYDESTYFAFGTSGETFEVEKEEPEVVSEEPKEETTEAVTEEVKEEVTMISVGNPDVGTVEIPSDFILADYDTSVLSKVKSKYAYKSPDGMSYVVLLKYSNSAKNIKKRASSATSAFIPDYTVVTGEEASRLPQAYFGYGESGNSRVETYTVSAKSDGFTRVLAIVAPKDSELFKTWETYTVEGGFNTLPGESPIPNVPEGMKVVGNEELGYILVADAFNEDSAYNYDHSKGWTREGETIAIISEKGSLHESVPLSEYAEYVKGAYLGEGAEEWDSGDWFPGALYSRSITEEKKTEIFCFKGKDGINRTILVISPGDDAEVSTYYKNYVLTSGVNENIEN